MPNYITYPANNTDFGKIVSACHSVDFSQVKHFTGWLAVEVSGKRLVRTNARMQEKMQGNHSAIYYQAQGLHQQSPWKDSNLIVGTIAKEKRMLNGLATAQRRKGGNMSLESFRRLSAKT